MKLVFNGSGTHIKQNIKTGDKFLKVRIDFKPQPGEKTYLEYPYALDGNGLPADLSVYRAWQKSHGYNQHVYVPVFPESGYPGKVDEFGDPVDWDAYNTWVDSLPHIWQLNPCISCFFTISETIKTDDFLLDLSTRFTENDIATLDNYLILPDSLHYVNPFTKNRLKLTTNKVLTSDIEDLIASINTKFEKVDVLKASGDAYEIEPQSLDVGSAALNRNASFSMTGWSQIVEDNPVNDTGTIESAEMWLFAAETVGCLVGMVSMSGNDATTRDYESVGTVASGSKQTKSGLGISCITGDYIGISGDTGGSMERSTTGYSGVWYVGNTIDELSGTTMSSLSYDTISLYGTGTESGGGWSNIAKVGGITATDLAKVDGIAVADIAKINGVAV